LTFKYKFCLIDWLIVFSFLRTCKCSNISARFMKIKLLQTVNDDVG